jgi:asparagine synthase (glutamine-hydrolysing)
VCGIAGIAAFAGQGVSEERLLRMRDAMAHRGPDDVGTWISVNRQQGLAHRRLAIIDLSPGGKQPMRGSRGQSRIVLNGEIYNYRELRSELAALGWSFRTESDTEVLLAAYGEWGDRCVEKLDGMFAFGLIDEERGCLVLARDRAGEKPLYLRQTASGVAFASELKAILVLEDVERKIDTRALNFYLSYGYVPAPLAVVAGIEKIPPATQVTIDLMNGTRRERAYWSLPRLTDTQASEVELEQELDRLLARAVRMQMVADVPVGISLSGGVDSSLITAFAARVSSKPLRTFTATFPDARRYDEAGFARTVANYFGTDHHELVVGRDIAVDLPEMIRQFDEPLADSSLLPTFAISRLTRQHVTVALGGDGGDELFGGYSIYGQTLRLAKLSARVPRGVRNITGRLALAALPVGWRGRNLMASLRRDLRYQHVTATSVFGEYDRLRLVSGEVRERIGDAIGEPEMVRYARISSSDPLDWMTRSDFASYLPGDILAKVDRASMRVALEMRSPWLDRQVMEFAFGAVPTDLKFRAGRSKELPKRLARRLLPKELNVDRKQGFSIPLEQWIAHDWRERLDAATAALVDGGVVRRSAVNALTMGQERGRSNSTRLFSLLMLGGWMETYRMSL